MLPEAAAIIRSLVSGTSRSLVLNIGSSTPAFYQEQQPYIWTDVMAPLEARGNQLINIDAKPGADFQAQADALPFHGVAHEVLCCNILEHVPDPGAVIKSCAQALKLHGRIIFEGPRDYPRHEDPIDTMLRPQTASEWDTLVYAAEPRLSREYAVRVVRESNFHHTSMVVSYRLRPAPVTMQSPLSFGQEWHPNWPNQMWLWLNMNDQRIGHVLLSRKTAIEDGVLKTLGGIGSLEVTRGFRKRGLGAFLLNEALEQMRSRWHTDYGILWCLDPLVKWYTSLGWHRVTVGQPPQHENLMTTPGAAGWLDLQDDLW